MGSFFLYRYVNSESWINLWEYWSIYRKFESYLQLGSLRFSGRGIVLWWELWELVERRSLLGFAYMCSMILIFCCTEIESLPIRSWRRRQLRRRCFTSQVYLCMISNQISFASQIWTLNLSSNCVIGSRILERKSGWKGEWQQRLQRQHIVHRQWYLPFEAHS